MHFSSSGHNPVGAVAAQLPAATTHPSHFVEERRQDSVRDHSYYNECLAFCFICRN